MVRCCFCPLNFNNPEDICLHIKKHHSGINAFRCTICERAAFTELWKYKRHLLNVCFQDNITEEADDTIEANNMSEFEKTVDDHALALVCKIASNMNVPRSHTFEVINEFKNFYALTVLKGFDQYVIPRVKIEEESNVEGFIQICRNPFRSVDTESKLDTELKKRDLVSSFDQFDIAENSRTESDHKPEYGVLMPLAYQFKKFFELEGVYELTQEFATEASNDTNISHFLNGSVWKGKLKSFKATDIVIPFHVHIDDTQVNNALGSHRSKGLETCCYYSFPSIPPQYCSRLENIFAAQLLPSDANKRHGNFACFHKLVEEVNKISQEPVTLNIDGKEIEVKNQLFSSAFYYNNQRSADCRNSHKNNL